jgi:glycosyltransferase involved in cell wall biosynthesis
LSNFKTSIIITLDWFLPGTNSGGPVRSIANLVQNLPDIDFMIITSDTDYLCDVPYSSIESNRWVRFSKNVQVFYFSKENLTHQKMTKVILATGIQTIYINGIYSKHFSQWPIAIARKSGLKSIIASRGMLSQQALKVKAFKKRLFLSLINSKKIFKNSVFHVTSPQEEKDVRKTINQFSSIVQIPNLPRTNHSDQKVKIKEVGSLEMIYVGRISPEKGLLEGLVTMNQLSDGELKLDIYGGIYDTKYWNECLNFIKNMDSRFEISYKGIADSEAIPALIQEYHFLFSPTKGENYGHAIVESLLNKRPVIITKNTPWDKITENEAGFDISIDEFTSVLKKALDLNNANFQEYCQNSRKYIENKIDLNNFINCYKSLFNFH